MKDGKISPTVELESKETGEEGKKGTMLLSPPLCCVYIDKMDDSKKNKKVLDVQARA